MSYDGHSQIPLKEMGYSEYRRDSQLSRAPISEMYGHQAHGGVAAGSSYRPPSPGRVSTYPRGSSPTNQISRAPSARIPVTHVVTMSPRKSSPSALPAAPPVAAASQLELPIHSGGGYHSVINSNIRQSSPVRRSPSPSLRDLQAPERRDQYKVIREEFPSAPPSVGIQSGILQPPDAVDVSAWRLRLNQMTAEELRHLIIQQYDRNSSGSIDFCDFLSLWFSQQTFQIRRSSAIATELGKETEPLEVLPKHIYRIREVFNEYEESYLAGIRYGLISAMLKDLMYDQDHEVQHYYGMSTDDMVALIEELAHHRQSRSSGNKEPRYDFAYILQLLFKYISDTEEVALFYDEGCKVFQSLRTKEYGEQPIYQNSTISTKLLVKVLAAPPSFKKMDMTYDDRGYEESLTLP